MPQNNSSKELETEVNAQFTIFIHLKCYFGVNHKSKLVFYSISIYLTSFSAIRFWDTRATPLNKQMQQMIAQRFIVYKSTQFKATKCTTYTNQISDHHN